MLGLLFGKIVGVTFSIRCCAFHWKKLELIKVVVTCCDRLLMSNSNDSSILFTMVEKGYTSVITYIAGWKPFFHSFAKGE